MIFRTQYTLRFFLFFVFLSIAFKINIHIQPNLEDKVRMRESLVERKICNNQIPLQIDHMRTFPQSSKGFFFYLPWQQNCVFIVETIEKENQNESDTLS